MFKFLKDKLKDAVSKFKKKVDEEIEDEVIESEKAVKTEKAPKDGQEQKPSDKETQSKEQKPQEQKEPKKEKELKETQKSSKEQEEIEEQSKSAAEMADGSISDSKTSEKKGFFSKLFGKKDRHEDISGISVDEKDQSAKEEEKAELVKEEIKEGPAKEEQKADSAKEEIKEEQKSKERIQQLKEEQESISIKEEQETASIREETKEKIKKLELEAKQEAEIDLSLKKDEEKAEELLRSQEEEERKRHAQREAEEKRKDLEMQKQLREDKAAEEQLKKESEKEKEAGIKEHPEEKKQLGSETIEKTASTDSDEAEDIEKTASNEAEDIEKTISNEAKAIEEEHKKEELADKHPDDEPAPEKKGFFRRFTDTITTKKISEDKFEELFWELEIALLENSIAVEVIEKVKADLKEDIVGKPIPRKDISEIVMKSLKRSIENLFRHNDIDVIEDISKKKKEGKPYVICFVGINGSGKTTTIAKFVYMLKKNGFNSVIAAADTFRAAAIDQLEIHAEKLETKMIKHDYNADPAAVAFDAIRHAESKKKDVVVIDTAGRLHSNSNLMSELHKIVNVAKPDLTIFVGEAITGNDCIEQAREFDKMVEIDGIILSKADIDQKGGAAISISYVLQKPIMYFGVGQNYEDLREFSVDFIKKSLGF
jgi:fused signal recognition particle receptor